MEDEILFQGPGYTIARTHKAETLVPYGYAERPNGHVNHGWIDLRDHPERVAEIPEAHRSAGLAKLLRAMADPVSKVMSSACECAAFDNSADASDRPPWQVGGFVMAVFREVDRNTEPQNFVDLAGYLLNGVGPSSEYQFGFEMIVEPLKTFFGRSDCYALMIKPMGYGVDESEAWEAFDHAASSIAEALSRDRPQTAPGVTG